MTVNRLGALSGAPQSATNNITGGGNNSAAVAAVKKPCAGLGISIMDFFSAESFKNLEQELK